MDYIWTWEGINHGQPQKFRFFVSVPSIDRSAYLIIIQRSKSNSPVPTPFLFYLFHPPFLSSSSSAPPFSPNSQPSDFFTHPMATLLKTLPFKSPPPLTPRVSPISLNSPKPFLVCFKQRPPRTTCPLRFSFTPSLRFVKLVPFASNGGETETTETQQEVQEAQIEVTLAFSQ